MTTPVKANMGPQEKALLINQIPFLKGKKILIIGDVGLDINQHHSPRTIRVNIKHRRRRRQLQFHQPQRRYQFMRSYNNSIVAVWI